MGIRQQVGQLHSALFYQEAAAYLTSVFPLPDGTGVSAGAVLTSGAPGWGAYADVVPVVAGIAVDFWVYGVHYCTVGAGAIQIMQVLLADATPTIFFYDEINATAVTLNVPPTILPFPKKFAAKAQVQGKAGGAAARTLNVAVMYATGL